MKTQKLILMGAATFLLSFVVNATPIIPSSDNITVSGGVDVTAAPKSDIGNLGTGTIWTWVTTDVANYNHLNSTTLPAPTASDSMGDPFVSDSTFPDNTLSITLTLGTYDYIFLHWGNGHTGDSGGVIQLYYIGGLSGTYDFDAPVVGNGQAGGLSGYSIFGPNTTTTVPDGGLTMSMLGASITGIAFLNRRLKK